MIRCHGNMLHNFLYITSADDALWPPRAEQLLRTAEACFTMTAWHAQTVTRPGQTNNAFCFLLLPLPITSLVIFLVILARNLPAVVFFARAPPPLLHLLRVCSCRNRIACRSRACPL